MVRNLGDAVAATTKDHPRALADEADLLHAYEVHGAELYRFAMRRLGDAGEAQDVVQETFLRAWHAAAGFDPARASLRSWLFAIARNELVDQGRRTRARPWRGQLCDPADLERLGGAAPDETDRLVWRSVVHEALLQLSDDHRQAVVETYLRDRTYRDVAEDLAVPEATVRTRVFYALKALRAEMMRMVLSP